MKRLLIVDDQQGIRLLLNEVLKKEGYVTYLAASGLEALKYADEQDMDCVLLDMKIPGMDGIEILRRLKEKFPKLPVFMMTAYGELDVVQEALNLGAIRYFTKPFDIFEVRDEVNKVLQV
ncbi:response regulator [Lysinibacillus fusiformis]|uniref:response regulator n=1 Tax=Lysinibacillus fusiformis TaxID=28031 RepID=UPI001880EA75|nr:response regulator [Lysinibacillus fusiformis]MBD8519478.1 response regulator [Lysinibacillus fusiformis]